MGKLGCQGGPVSTGRAGPNGGQLLAAWWLSLSTRGTPGYSGTSSLWCDSCTLGLYKLLFSGGGSRAGLLPLSQPKLASLSLCLLVSGDGTLKNGFQCKGLKLLVQSFHLRLTSVLKTEAEPKGGKSLARSKARGRACFPDCPYPPYMKGSLWMQLPRRVGGFIDPGLGLSLSRF